MRARTDVRQGYGFPPLLSTNGSTQTHTHTHLEQVQECPYKTYSGRNIDYSYYEFAGFCKAAIFAFFA